MDSVDPGISYVPLTDSQITPQEVSEAICTIKPNKSGGPSEICPGVLRSMTPTWIVFLAHLFTGILFYASIPTSWCFSRLTVRSKKGPRTSCDNYRGIPVMDTFAKLYDLILFGRLDIWCKPSREQAGAHKGRGCVEHILSLRLLFDYAMSRKSISFF